jgi:hypothetical protein
MLDAFWASVRSLKSLTCCELLASPWDFDTSVLLSFLLIHTPSYAHIQRSASLLEFEIDPGSKHRRSALADRGYPLESHWRELLDRVANNSHMHKTSLLQTVASLARQLLDAAPIDRIIYLGFSQVTAASELCCIDIE